MVPVSFKTLFMISLFLTALGEIGPDAAGGLFLICWVVFFFVNNIWLSLTLGLVLCVTIAFPALILAAVMYAVLYMVYKEKGKIQPVYRTPMFDNRGRPIEDAVFTEVA